MGITGQESKYTGVIIQGASIIVLWKNIPIRPAIPRYASRCSSWRLIVQEHGQPGVYWVSQKILLPQFKKTEGWAWQVNERYIQEHQVKEVIVVSSEQIEVEEAEMDEMWSFVHDKSQQYWLWWAIDHQTGTLLAYCFGTREHKNLDELRALLAPFQIDTVYADDNYAYKKRITESAVITGKKNTQG